MLPCDVAATLTSSHACKSEVSSRSQKEDVAFVVAVVAARQFGQCKPADGVKSARVAHRCWSYNVSLFGELSLHRFHFSFAVILARRSITKESLVRGSNEGGIVLDGGSRISDLKCKLMTIELLNLAKNYYTYRELSQIIGLPDTVLSRYVKGHVLPTMDRALYINKTMEKVMGLEAEIQLRIRFDDSGYFDNTRLIFDPLLLKRAVLHAVNSSRGHE